MVDLNGFSAKSAWSKNSVILTDNFFFDDDPSSSQIQAKSSTAQVRNQPHMHPYFQIWYAKRGSYRHFLNGNEFMLEQGSIVIVPPHFPHFLDTSGAQVEMVSCDFTESFIFDIADSKIRNSLVDILFIEPVLAGTNQIKPYHHFSPEVTAEIDRIFDELCFWSNKNDVSSSIFMRSDLLRLFAQLSREQAEIGRNMKTSAYREALDSALAYINAHYLEKLYLEDICKIAKMNRQTFTYLFKQIVGIPFSKYVQYLRVQQAKEQLINTDMSNRRIAVACGFQSPSFFNRVFKEFTGCSPGVFKQNLKQKK